MGEGGAKRGDVRPTTRVLEATAAAASLVLVRPIGEWRSCNNPTANSSQGLVPLEDKELSPVQETCRRRLQLLAGGSVLMERSKEGSQQEMLEHCTDEELEMKELEEHVWLLLWLVLGPNRLNHITEENEKETVSASRLVWRALQLCCSAEGTKSAAAVPLTPEHPCDAVCLRDHASRMLEVCAPTRELWRVFGWAGLTVDSVLRKVLKEDVVPHLALLPRMSEEVRASLKRLEACQLTIADRKAAREHAIQQETSSTPRLLVEPVITRRKRGRPAKAPGTTRREPGRLERVFLWRFLLELLEDSRLSGCLRWVQRDEGIFRILNTDLLARLWGRRHGNPRMTYEKMARAMRTYYRSKVLLPVPRARNLPRKLVYRFAPSVIQKVVGSTVLPMRLNAEELNAQAAS